MGFALRLSPTCYGLSVMGEVWVMSLELLQTRSVDSKTYGVWGSMAYEGYGLRESRL
jgi:hypothetical protein